MCWGRDPRKHWEGVRKWDRKGGQPTCYHASHYGSNWSSVLLESSSSPGAGEVIFGHQFSSVMDLGLLGVRDSNSLAFPVCHMDRQGKPWCSEKVLWQKDAGAGSWTLVQWHQHGQGQGESGREPKCSALRISFSKKYCLKMDVPPIKSAWVWTKLNRRTVESFQWEMQSWGYVWKQVTLA